MDETTLLGLRTVIYAAPDLDATKHWYAGVLGIDPYFDQPFYVGFNVGGYELGLVPDALPAQAMPNDAVTYWGVSDLDTVLAHWLSAGATVHVDKQDVGDGIQTAVVKDPFGNVIGLIKNPHFSL